MRVEGKLYYGTGEVAEMLGVAESTLRFWERNFPQFRPRRSEKGTRRFTAADVEVGRQIRELVRERGYSVRFARKKLAEFCDSRRRALDDDRFICESAGDALRLLGELKVKFEDDVIAVARLDAISQWVEARK